MKKLLPYPLIYIEQIEKWLNQMSLEGYHLKKMNKNFATFNEGHSEDIKYSIIFYKKWERHDISIKNLGVEAYLGSYTEYSWQLLQSEILYKGIEYHMDSEFCSVYKSIINKPSKKTNRYTAINSIGRVNNETEQKDV